MYESHTQWSHIMNNKENTKTILSLYRYLDVIIHLQF